MSEAVLRGDRSTLALAAAAVVVFAALPWFTGRYQTHLLVLSMWYAVVALGLGVLLGFAGQWSFAPLGFSALGGVIMYWVNVQWAVPYWASAAAVVLAVAAVSAVVAVPAFRAKRHYFALVTFAYIIIMHQLGLSLPEVTGGGTGLRGFSDIPLPGLTITSITEYYYAGLVTVLVCVYLVSRLESSHLGRVFKAIRENERMAENVGIDVYWYKVLAFTLAGALAALGGIGFTSYQNNIDPTFYHPIESFLIVVMVVIGGVRRIEGWLLGVLLVFFLPEMLRSGSTLRYVVFGVLLLTILYLEPRGLTALGRRAYRATRLRLDGLVAEYRDG